MILSMSVPLSISIRSTDMPFNFLTKKLRTETSSFKKGMYFFALNQREYQSFVIPTLNAVGDVFCPILNCLSLENSFYKTFFTYFFANFRFNFGLLVCFCLGFNFMFVHVFGLRLNRPFQTGHFFIKNNSNQACFLLNR